MIADCKGEWTGVFFPAIFAACIFQIARVSGQVVTENRIPVCCHNAGIRAVKPDQEGDIINVINVIFIIVVLVNVIVSDVINETMMSGEVLEAGNNSIW